MPLTKQQFIELRGKGLSVEQIVEFENQQPKQATQKGPGYFERVGQGYQQAGQDITSSFKRGVEKGVEYKASAERKRDTGDLLGGLGDVAKFTGEVARTGLRVAGGIAGAVFNPITEAPGIKQGLEAVGEGITKVPGVREIVTKAGEIAQKYPEAAKDLQNIVDIAVVGSSLKPTKVLQGAAKKPALGLAERGFQGVEKTGTALKGLGEKAYGISVPLQESTKIAVQAYNQAHPTLAGRIFGMFSNATYAQEGVKKAIRPITEAQTAARYGLTGTEKIIGEQAKNVSGNLFKNVIAPKLAQSKNIVDMRQFLKNLESKINKIPELGRRTDLKEAFKTFKNEYKNVGNISGIKLQEYKEGWAKFIAEKSSFKGGKPIGGAYKELQNMAAQEARPLLYNSIGKNGLQAYIDYGNLKSIAEFGIKVQDTLRSKGITKQAWEFILDTGVTPVTTLGGNILYKTGEGLEFIGKQGAKTVRDIISGSGGTSLGGGPISGSTPPKTGLGSIKITPEESKRILGGEGLFKSSTIKNLPRTGNQQPKVSKTPITSSTPKPKVTNLPKNISKEAIQRGVALQQIDNQISSFSADITSREIASMRKILNATDFSSAKTTKEVAEIFIKQLPNNLKTAERITFIRRISSGEGLLGSLIKELNKGPSTLQRFFTNNPESIKFFK